MTGHTHEAVDQMFISKRTVHNFNEYLRSTLVSILQNDVTSLPIAFVSSALFVVLFGPLNRRDVC